MTTLAYWLSGLFTLAAALCTWAAFTAQERPGHRAPRHARWKTDGPARTNTWYVITDYPELEAAPVTTRDNLPWRPPARRDFPWPPVDDHALDE